MNYYPHNSQHGHNRIGIHNTITTYRDKPLINLGFSSSVFERSYIYPGQQLKGANVSKIPCAPPPPSFGVPYRPENTNTSSINDYLPQPPLRYINQPASSRLNRKANPMESYNLHGNMSTDQQTSQNYIQINSQTNTVQVNSEANHGKITIKSKRTRRGRRGGKNRRRYQQRKDEIDTTKEEGYPLYPTDRIQPPITLSDVLDKDKQLVPTTYDNSLSTIQHNIDYIDALNQLLESISKCSVDPQQSFTTLSTSHHPLQTMLPDSHQYALSDNSNETLLSGIESSSLSSLSSDNTPNLFTAENNINLFRSISEPSDDYSYVENNTSSTIGHSIPTTITTLFPEQGLLNTSNNLFCQTIPMSDKTSQAASLLTSNQPNLNQGTHQSCISSTTSCSSIGHHHYIDLTGQYSVNSPLTIEHNHMHMNTNLTNDRSNLQQSMTSSVIQQSNKNNKFVSSFNMPHQQSFHSPLINEPSKTIWNPTDTAYWDSSTNNNHSLLDSNHCTNTFPHLKVQEGDAGYNNYLTLQLLNILNRCLIEESVSKH